MDERSPKHLLTALGYGFTHLIDTKPVAPDGSDQDCQVVYLYQAPGAEDLSIFGLNFTSGTDTFGDVAWCNATYDAIDELAVGRPDGEPLAFLICTPMPRRTPDDARGFWYGIGMELVQGTKITITQESSGPYTVKPVQQEAMTGMLEQLGEALTD